MIAILFTGLVGLAFIYLGIVTLNGTYKKWYLGPRVYPPQALLYAQIPLGIAFVVMSVAVVFASHFGYKVGGMITLWVAFPIALFGLVLAFWRPRWIRPRWVRWLEDNYEDRIYTLIAAARQDPKAWEKRVATQEGLEDWAREVAGSPASEQEAEKQRRKVQRNEEEKIVRAAIEAFDFGKVYSVSDLKHACPGLSSSAIQHVLFKLAYLGQIRQWSSGRSVQWERLSRN